MIHVFIVINILWSFPAVTDRLPALLDRLLAFLRAPKAEAAPEPQAFRGSSFFGSVSHWFHSMFDSTPPPAPVPVQLPPVDPNAGRPPFSTQNIEKTARSLNTPSSTEKSMELYIFPGYVIL